MTLTISLDRKERFTIANAINTELKRLVADYHASCDRKAPNLVLFVEIGRLQRLREKVLTGKDYDEQDADAGEAADASERMMFEGVA